jgi:hypothetical protein
MSTPEFVRLLGSIRAHLCNHALDARIASVEVASFDAGVIEVRLDHGDLAELATVLLAWADSLTRYYPWVWRNRYSGTVYLRLTGQLPDYTGIGISGAVPDTDTTFSDLQSGDRQYLTLTDLTVWAAGDGTVTP